MDLQTIVAQAHASEQAHATDKPERDPLRAWEPMSAETALAGGHGSVLFARRKSTGVLALVYLPESRKRAQGVPVSAILAAGFVPSEDASAEPAPEPEPEPEDAEQAPEDADDDTDAEARESE